MATSTGCSEEQHTGVHAEDMLEVTEVGRPRMSVPSHTQTVQFVDRFREAMFPTGITGKFAQEHMHRSLITQ